MHSLFINNLDKSNDRLGNEFSNYYLLLKCFKFKFKFTLVLLVKLFKISIGIF